MKKVLIFTYYWPPAGGPGVQRFLKFSKYLGEFGIEPIIVTVNNGSYPYLDESLIKDIPENLKVYKTKTFEPFRIYNIMQGEKKKFSSVAMVGIKDSESIFHKFSKFIRANYFIPDARKGWNRFAYKKGLKIINEYDIDMIITTGPPHSTHLIGLRLKHELNIPWIADLRDPWPNILNLKDLPRTKRAQIKDEKLKDKVLRSADYITIVSDGLKNQIIDKNEDIRVIYNGYDEEDFNPALNTLSAGPSTDEFVITYTGTLLDDYDIEVFFKVLKNIIGNNSSINYKLRFVGEIPRSTYELIEESNLSENIEVTSYVTHAEAIDYLMKSTVLLLVIPNVRNNEGILTGKLFEYLASRKPIICLGPKHGNAAKVIRECEAGAVFSASGGERDMVDELSNHLQKLSEKWLDDSNLDLKDGKYDIYSRRNQTKELAEIIKDIL